MVSYIWPLSAFYLANEYIRAMGQPGLVDDRVDPVKDDVHLVTDRIVSVASGESDEDVLVRLSEAKRETVE